MGEDMTSLEQRSFTPEVKPWESLESAVSPSPEKIKELTKGSWASDWQVIKEKLVPEQIPQDQQGRILRTEAVVAVAFPEASDSVRKIVLDVLKRQLDEAEVSISDPNVSLLPLARNLAPLVEKLEAKPPEPEISEEDKARLEEYRLLEQAAKDLGLEGARRLPEEISELQKTVAKAVGVVKGRSEEIRELREKSNKAAEESQWLREELKETRAKESRSERALAELKELAGLARGGREELRELDEWMAEIESPDVTAVLHLLKTIRESFGKERFNSLLKDASETFEKYQFVRVGETVELRGETYEIIKRLGGGAMGEVFLSEAKSGWNKGMEVVWKVSKDPEYIEREYIALLGLRSIQEEAGLKGNEYTPGYYQAGGKEQNFAVPFFLMEYVPGKDLIEVVDEIRSDKRSPLKEEEVRKIFLQITHLGSLLEREKSSGLYGGGELTITGDFKLGRIKIYDEDNLRIKIIDWSLPGIKEEKLPKETQRTLGILGIGMSRLLGGNIKEPPEETNEEMRIIILKCLGTQKEKFPPYQTFTELYEDLKKASGV